MIRLLRAALEGFRFLWQFRRATPAYVRWRLGTVYGGFATWGEERGIHELVGALVADRHRVVEHLLWRRRMRAWRR